MSRSVAGACPLDCPDTCAWHIEVDALGRAVSLRGDREHPFTRGALCGKVNRYLDALYAPDRLLHPLRRVGAKGAGQFERISWEEAIELAARGIQRAIDEDGPESVLPYYYAGTMGQVQGWTLGPRLFAALGASKLGTTICSAASTAALTAIHGAKVGLDPEDIAYARLVLIWGGNLLYSNVHQWRFILAAREAGGHIVTIDPLRTATADHSDEHVKLRPGTDGALALGLMRAVLDAGAADRDWLERHAVGWPELEARLREWPPARAAEECGVSLAQLEGLGQRLAATRPAAIRMGLGLQRHGGAGAAVRAISAISAVTGDWRHVGGGVAGNVSDHFPVATTETVYPSDLPRRQARTINMSRLGEALLTVDDPPVRALVVFNANPGASNPAQRQVHEGLARDDLCTVVLEHRLTDTADFADVVLPATMQPEHIDLHTAYGHLYMTWNEPAVAPPGECLPNTEIFRRLARALGLDHPRFFDSDLDIARQLLDTDGCRAAGITLETLRERGWQRTVDYPAGTAPFADGGFPSPSGKVELRSDGLASLGLDPLVGYVPPYEVVDSELAERYPLVLLCPASRFFLNSTFASTPWHLRKAGPLTVHVHPDDAAVRSLEEGEAIVVRNDRGSFEAVVTVDDAAAPGVAFLYKSHWAKLLPGGFNANATTPQRDADMGGSPTFHDNRVEIEPLRVGRRAHGLAAVGAAAPDEV
ncbi:MAG: molybdopterin-dependent oxidoreductase [Actinomycetia bacterium]|nr:molybdopterin-dependent oxidoreductase [Actinomycetes bacterium]